MPSYTTFGASSAFSFGNQAMFLAGANSASYTTAGTYSWVAPAGVYKLAIVAVGAGSRGGAGGLGWVNNVSVAPGQTYTVVVGAATTGGKAGDSHFVTPSGNSVIGFGANGNSGGSFFGDGGGRGGNGSYGGGGAGGYTGQGGDANVGSGTGGGAGAGGYDGGTNNNGGSGGGGVGILGQGPNGVGQASGAGGGTGGSGGTQGGGGQNNQTGNGGVYGGGGGNNGPGPGLGGGGAVRIVWQSITRQFPTTNVGAP